MPLGNKNFSHQEIMNYTNCVFENTFGDTVTLLECIYSEKSMGYYKLIYNFIPKKYKIEFECDRLYFSIRIIDVDGSHTSISRMIDDHRLNTVLEKTNISQAIKLLSENIDRDDICFYINKDNKYYKKMNGKFTRVKYPFMK